MALENGTPKKSFMLQDCHENDAQTFLIHENHNRKSHGTNKL
jgi:hypothetical protein